MVQLVKWYQEESPSKNNIRTQMEAEGLSVQMWKKGSGENQEPAAAEKGLSLCVIDGMARVILPDSPEGYEDLMAGDRIDIPSGTKFGLLVGPAGVTMMQGVN